MIIVWTFHGTGVNNKIDYLHKLYFHIVHNVCIVRRVHELSHRIDYKDSNSSFKDLFKKYNSLKIFSHLPWNYSSLKENLSNTIINNILQTRTMTYNLRSQTNSTRSYVNTLVVLAWIHFFIFPQQWET